MLEMIVYINIYKIVDVSDRLIMQDKWHSGKSLFQLQVCISDLLASLLQCSYKKSIQRQKNENVFQKHQSSPTGVIRMTPAYGTVSIIAQQVGTETVPTELLVEGRRLIHRV